MTAILKRIRKDPAQERITEAYEVRAFRDESEQPASKELRIGDYGAKTKVWFVLRREER